jgi:hypothetical protein
MNRFIMVDVVSRPEIKKGAPRCPVRPVRTFVVVASASGCVASGRPPG